MNHQKQIMEKVQACEVTTEWIIGWCHAAACLWGQREASTVSSPG